MGFCNSGLKFPLNFLSLKFGKMFLNLSFWRLHEGKEGLLYSFAEDCEGQFNLLRRKRKEIG